MSLVTTAPPSPIALRDFNGCKLKGQTTFFELKSEKLCEDHVKLYNEVIKELPITLILRPFNFETFATQAYIYASQDLLEAAALPSLFLIFWSTILIVISSRYILSKKN